MYTARQSGRGGQLQLIATMPHVDSVPSAFDEQSMKQDMVQVFRSANSIPSLPIRDLSRGMPLSGSPRPRSEPSRGLEVPSLYIGDRAGAGVGAGDQWPRVVGLVWRWAAYPQIFWRLMQAGFA